MRRIEFSEGGGGMTMQMDKWGEPVDRQGTADVGDREDPDPAGRSALTLSGPACSAGRP